MARKNPSAVALGRLGGKVKSEAKAAAVRANGKLHQKRPLPCIRCSALTLERDKHRRAWCGCG